MNLEGILLGAGAFLCIGLFHPLVIIAFSSFWSIGEVIKQRKRVLKGWFPKNPKRLNDYQNEP